MRRMIIAAATVLAMGGPALADGYDTVREALDSGDYDTAYATLAEMGDSGDTLAAIMLANLQMGYATNGPNYGIARAWLEQAADEGSIHAMIQLGWMYQFQAPALVQEWGRMGDGYAEAIGWFERAADAGSVVALSRLGMLHRLGVLPMVDETVSADDERQWSLEFLERAVDAGQTEAMAGLAMSVRRDDPDRTAMLMQQAAILGDATAVGMLAGQPVVAGIEDPVEQLAWKLAAITRWELDRNPRSPVWIVMGVESEAEMRGWIVGELSAATPDDLAAAEIRAAEISADWPSYLPGQSDSGDDGGLFGDN